VLATDGDGTLWTGDVGDALFEVTVREGWIGDDALQPLRAELVANLPDEQLPKTAAETVHLMWRRYLEGRFPEDRIWAAMAWCMAGTPLAEVAARAREMLEGPFDLPSRLIPEAIAVLRWADARGVATWLVSSSPRVVVEAAAAIVAREAGVTVPSVLAMTPRIEDGVIRAALDGTLTYGEGKATALDEALAESKRSILAAMGDNAPDVAMLRRARVPLAIRPKPALRAIIGEIPGILEVSPIHE
jgi:phosphatidylglycerophosphatase C